MKEFQLLRYLSKGKILIFIVALLGSFWVYFYADSQQVYTATTVIRYSNDAISGGMTPNGSKLDVSEIYSSTVIKGAIENMGLNIMVDEVRSKVKVTPIIPEDEEEKKKTAISKNEEYYYFPTDYIISYEVGSERSAVFAENMLDAIVNSYYSFYSEKYVDQLILPNNASNIKANDYDYLESVDMLKGSVKEIDDYLMQKRASYPYFRASATGYSFSDLENIYSYIINNKVPHLYASILQNKYTKDNDLLLKKQQSIISGIEIDILNSQEKAAKLKTLIDNYSDKNIKTQRTNTGENGESDVIMDVNGYNSGINVETTYDDLIQEYVKINQSIKNNEIDKANAEYIKSVFANNRRNKVVNAELEQEIDDLIEMLNGEYKNVQATAKELNEYIGASYLNILNSVVSSQKINITLYLALAAVFFVFFGCAGAVLIGRLNDFVQYILYTDKITKLPNRQMCDVQINAISEKRLPEQYTIVVIKLDSLIRMNEMLGHSAGDTLMRDFGDILKSVTRNYGFIGWNQGSFLGLFDQCTAEKAELFKEILDKRVKEYNEKQLELEIAYSIAFSNSTDDEIYEIRNLIHRAYDRLFGR